MSSWVAPAVAAEIWGVSVDQVLTGIAHGSIPSYVDGEFLFVDVASNGYASSTPRPAPIDHPVVSREELHALTFEPIGDQRERSAAEALDEDFAPDEEPDSHDISLWRTAREQASHLRRPPQAEAA